MKPKKIKDIIKTIRLYITITIFILIVIIIGISYKAEIEEEKLKLENELNNVVLEINIIIDNAIRLLNNVEIDDFESVYKFYDNIEYIYFVKDDGNISIYPQINIPTNFNPKEKKWYIEALENGTAITYSYSDVEKTIPVITISKHVNNGILGIDLKSNVIFDILLKYKKIDINNIYLVKENGEIIYSYDNNNYGKYSMENMGFLYIRKKVNKDIYLLYKYDIKHINNKYIKKGISVLIILSILYILLYNFTRKYIDKNFIIPIEKVENAMQNFNYNAKDKTIYLNNKCNIYEINSIVESFNVLTSTIIASSFNFKLATDEIKKMYNSLESINNMFINIISLITKIDEKDLSLEEYYKILLKNLIDTIPEAETGSISILENNNWIYVTAIGHDINKLKKIKIEVDSKFFKNYNGIKITTYKELFNINKNILDEYTYNLLKEGTKSFHKAMSYVNYSEKFSLLISIETNKDDFSENSINVFKAFNSISKIFFEKKLELDKIQDIYFKFAEKLASVAEGYDDITGKHIYRVGEISSFLAKKIGYGEKEVEKIKKFAPLHDIGKIYVPNKILNKEGKLTSEEWEEMKKHTIYAKKLLDNDNYFELALNIALYHHENFDGSGYPFGLKGDQIPIEAAIVKIVDIYDALRSKRSYKEEFTHELALKIITSGDDRVKPEHFNPKILEVFEKYNDEIRKIWDKINGGEIDGYKSS
ncbi:HD domain-containing phosphohydrolase [Marinitoga sp. 38H-ov]|uniref:HD domain-containing phosphohydrolase n=1 Tax=Marinitoga sp. 38H-ov TaxID=1755814 RepID=UPI0019D17F36|nr:HD domain-containing phosphohydrolase [Marinitoga sp. 38H-ov]